MVDTFAITGSSVVQKKNRLSSMGYIGNNIQAPGFKIDPNSLIMGASWWFTRSQFPNQTRSRRGTTQIYQMQRRSPIHQKCWTLWPPLISIDSLYLVVLLIPSIFFSPTNAGNVVAARDTILGNFPNAETFLCWMQYQIFTKEVVVHTL